VPPAQAARRCLSGRRRGTPQHNRAKSARPSPSGLTAEDRSHSAAALGTSLSLHSTSGPSGPTSTQACRSPRKALGWRPGPQVLVFEPAPPRPPARPCRRIRRAHARRAGTSHAGLRCSGRPREAVPTTAIDRSGRPTRRCRHVQRRRPEAAHGGLDGATAFELSGSASCVWPKTSQDFPSLAGNVPGLAPQTQPRTQLRTLRLLAGAGPGRQHPMGSNSGYAALCGRPSAAGANSPQLCCKPGLAWVIHRWPDLA